MRLNIGLNETSRKGTVTILMSTLVMPAEPNAMFRTDESSIIIFCTSFYTDYGPGNTTV
jgi:hypothetical protein